jgi:hypothetical protein
MLTTNYTHSKSRFGQLIFDQEIACLYGAQRFITIFTEDPSWILRQQVESSSQLYTEFL